MTFTRYHPTGANKQQQRCIYATSVGRVFVVHAENGLPERQDWAHVLWNTRVRNHRSALTDSYDPQIWLALYLYLEGTESR
jgi:hypothetical protein